jgi:hypothetical protein
MKLELSNGARRLLLRLVRDALDATKFPMSPEAEVLRELAEEAAGEPRGEARDEEKSRTRRW